MHLAFAFVLLVTLATVKGEDNLDERELNDFYTHELIRAALKELDEEKRQWTGQLDHFGVDPFHIGGSATKTWEHSTGTASLGGSLDHSPAGTGVGVHGSYSSGPLNIGGNLQHGADGKLSGGLEASYKNKNHDFKGFLNHGPGGTNAGIGYTFRFRRDSALEEALRQQELRELAANQEAEN